MRRKKGFFERMSALIGVIAIAIFLAAGIFEKRRNDRILETIPLRINVNGIRGKSTVTRLTTGVLAAGGYKVVGKTTGTAARMIYPGKEEVQIKRRPEGANIKEQINCLRKAHEYGANAMVFECMALKPEYQKLVQNQMVRAQIYVVVNVLEDHLDVMGPTTKEIAHVFAQSIPYGGVTITVPGPHIEVFDRVCRRRLCKLVIADDRLVRNDFLDEFDYELFPANAALAYAVARVLNIPRHVAEKGMLSAQPDPGASRIVTLTDPNLTFVNGFAANEPASSLAIWDRMVEKGYGQHGVVVIFNGRPDRVDRTNQFIRDFFPNIDSNAVVIGMGRGLRDLKRAYEKGSFPCVTEYYDMEGKTAAEIVQLLHEPSFAHTTVLGVGNIHGDAIDLIDLLSSTDASGMLSTLEHESYQKIIDKVKGLKWFHRS